MDFNLPPEMEHNIVYYGELFPILKRVMQLIMDVSENSTNHDSKTLDLLDEMLDELEYRRKRDLRFFFTLLTVLGYGPFEKLAKYYADWCKEYDELNKGDKSDT
jgi:hypothetical protein